MPPQLLRLPSIRLTCSTRLVPRRPCTTTLSVSINARVDERLMTRLNVPEPEARPGTLSGLCISWAHCNTQAATAEASRTASDVGQVLVTRACVQHLMTWWLPMTTVEPLCSAAVLPLRTLPSTFDPAALESAHRRHRGGQIRLCVASQICADRTVCSVLATVLPCVCRLTGSTSAQLYRGPYCRSAISHAPC